MYHEMTVFGLALDPLSQRPLVLLKDLKSQTSVPVWISSQEVVAIIAELISRNIAGQSGRDDLMGALLMEMGLTVSSILLKSFDGGPYSAIVRFAGGEEEVQVSVRPSEALVTALRYKLPVMVADDVVERATLLKMDDEAIVRENDARRFADFLENLDPEDMGKYPM